MRLSIRPKYTKDFDAEAWRARWQKAFDERIPFESSGAMSGSHWCYDSGRMEGAARDLYLQHSVDGHVDYVVRSYATPIAWHTTDGTWYVPSQRYSVTTGRHQGIVKRTLEWLHVTYVTV